MKKNETGKTTLLVQAVTKYLVGLLLVAALLFLYAPALPGYLNYQKTVKWRLVPLVW